MAELQQAHGGQRGVDDVEVAGKPALELEGAGRSGQREGRPVAVPDRPVGPRPEVRADGDDRHRALAGQPDAPLVVDAHHAAPGVRRREQQRLGGVVVLHRLVEVQVVLREVGEEGHVEDGAVDPVLGERVARDLHDDVGGARLPHHGEQRVQVGGLGRRADRLDPGVPDPGLHGSQQPGRLAERAEAGLDEVGGRGLAVGAGDPDEGEVAGGPAVDERGHVAEHGPRVRHDEDRHGGLLGQLGALSRR